MFHLLFIFKKIVKIYFVFFLIHVFENKHGFGLVKTYAGSVCFSRMSLDSGNPKGEQTENQAVCCLQPLCIYSVIHQNQSVFAKCFCLANECFVTKAQFNQKNPV